ncbi:MAG: hypothetical protein ACREGA_01450 [Candidatus Saccharimonadales bacterium]
MTTNQSPNQHHRTLGADDIFRVRKNLKLHHKALFIALVFVGLNFCWFGVWTTIEQIPILNNPLVAIVVGVILLMLAGKVNTLE